MELWEIKEIIDIKKKDKWDNIRNTCDAYDLEMAKLMKKK